MEVKYHTLIKHKILEEYLKSCNIAFRKKDGTKGKYGDFVFVETHAGDGEAWIRKHNKFFDGSAILAAKIEPKFPCIFIENDPECVRKLHEKLKGFSNTEIKPGSCDDVIKEVLKNLKNCITVVFVDPKNYNDVSWETVDVIRKNNSTDIILNFPLSIIGRAIKIESTWNDITKFFGTSEWTKYKDSKKELVKFYISRMGYKHTYILTVKSIRKKSPLYLMILGTNSPLGDRIGGWIWSKTIRNWMEQEFPKIVYQVRSLDEFMSKKQK